MTGERMPHVPAWLAKIRRALADLPEPQPVEARETVVNGDEPSSDIGQLVAQRFGELLATLPRPKDTGPARIDAGTQAMTWLWDTFTPARSPYELLPQSGAAFGIPVVLNESLGTRTVRLINRAGQVTHEWEIPRSADYPEAGK